MGKLNSRTKRKIKAGFKGIGSHKRFGIGKHINSAIEETLGNYNCEANRTCAANKTYANTVHAAIKHNTSFKMDATGNIIENNKYMKHIGSKSYDKILRAANPT